MDLLYSLYESYRIALAKANIRMEGAPVPLSQSDQDKLREALNYEWPGIQRQLLVEAAAASGQEDPYEPYWTTDEDGNRVLHFSPDAWWLQDYDERKVIFELGGISIFNTQPFHASSVSSTLRAAYGVHGDDDCDDCFTEEQIEAQIKRFPAGQFAAQRTGGPGAGFCVGMAVNMRATRPPTAPVLPWREAIGDMTLSAHEPEGDWIYGVEMAVDPSYRGHGIGTHFHIARFALAQALNLRGVYLVGMLMGYRERANRMDVAEYGERVIAGELKDPTVTMQLNRGFRPLRVVRDYCDEYEAGDAGVLLVWENPEYEADGTK